MTARRAVALLVLVAMTAVAPASGCAEHVKTKGTMTWDFTHDSRTTRMGWKPQVEGDEYTGTLDELRIELPTGLVIDIGEIGGPASVAALASSGPADRQHVLEMSIEFSGMTLDDAVDLAKRLSDEYGVDGARFDAWATTKPRWPGAGSNTWAERTLVPPDGLTLDIETWVRSDQRVSVLIGLSWP